MGHKRGKLPKAKYHVCKDFDLVLCGACPHGVPHLVVPTDGCGACESHCEHRNIVTWCVRTKKKSK